MGLRAGGSTSRRAGVSRQAIAPGRRRIGLLRDRQEPAAQFRGNQKRPRPFKWRPLLQRSRTSGVFDTRMHYPSPNCRARQSWRANFSGMRPAPKSEIGNRSRKGNSYGCHENYLVDRRTPFPRIVRDLTPFFVTRQIFTGAGKLGSESARGSEQRIVYQLTQRADFFEAEVGLETTLKRPIINTRDEPHADVNRYRRFHVILGDSNMSEWATAMKIGTTSLVLDLIERGKAPQLEIAQPIDANKSISRDQTYDWIIELKDGRKISAIDVQRIYLKAAADIDNGGGEDRQWILREWENVLNDLERDVMVSRDRVDWAAKKFLLNALEEEEKLAWSDPWLQSIDLEYHNVDLERGLYYELVRQGSMRRIVNEDEIKMSIFTPPETTRAFFRGRSVARFNDEITSIQWDEIVFANGSQSRRVALPEASLDARLDALNLAARNGKDFVEFIRALSEID
ncbi:MAG: hypothetical protein DMF17_10160 [Verrucomicrobia bacterium]|nr:MAG: hypothetical protein DMF17_10160 [Verrucomicrobiota bacterium]